MQALCHAHDIGEGHFALVRTTKHRGNVAAHAHAVGLCTLQHGHESFDGFIDRRVDVPPVEGL
jgi:hypothetical protein